MVLDNLEPDELATMTDDQFDQLVTKAIYAEADARARREVEELDSEEICNTMCLSSTNVRVLLHRARLALRKCLEQNWFGKGGDSSSLNLSSKRGAH
jgi:DNA-directed RNA polymerase specialized sigma24 family protein